jgi:hypothetical protein
MGFFAYLPKGALSEFGRRFGLIGRRFHKKKSAAVNIVGVL